MENYIKRTLKNGVKLYLYIDSKMKRTYVSYGVHYGSNGKWFNFELDDKKYHVQPGVAHFLEHMLGEHSKYGNIYRYFSEKGYNKNGLTWIDYTNYFFCGVNDIKESIKVLVNAIDDPVFTKEDVKETRYAIAEETKRTLNNKYNISHHIASRNLFKEIDTFHESLSTIGNEETTYDLDYDTLKACYDAFYYDENKTLLIAGSFDENEMIEYLESIYAELPSHPKRIKEHIYGDLDKKRKDKEIYHMATNDDIITIAFKEKMNNFSKKEVYYYLSLLFDFKLYDTEFIDNLKINNIITNICFTNSSFIYDEWFELSVCASVKEENEYITKMTAELKNNSFNEKEFNLIIKTYLANAARDKDYKYEKFRNFFWHLDFIDDFNDLEFIKTLTYDRFIEFYNSLSFDDYTIAIVRDN